MAELSNRYTDDRGRTIIKRAKNYCNKDDVTLNTLRTQLFLNRLASVDEKVTVTSQGLQHILNCVGDRILEAVESDIEEEANQLIKSESEE